MHSKGKTLHSAKYGGARPARVWDPDAAGLRLPGASLYQQAHGRESAAQGRTAAAGLRRLRLPAGGAAILKGLKKYGMCVADNDIDWAGSAGWARRRVVQVIKVNPDEAAAAMAGEQAEPVKPAALRLVAVFQGKHD